MRPAADARHAVRHVGHQAEVLIGQPVVGGAVGVDPDAVGRAAVVSQRDHGDACPAVDGEARLAPGQVDDDDIGPARDRVGGVRAARGQIAEPVGAGEHQPRRPRRIGVGLVLHVRQPLQPRPLGVLRIVGQNPQLQQVRRMEHRQVADHRGQQPGRAGRVAADRDGRKRAQLNEFRAVVDQAVGAQELGQPHVADRLEVRLRRALRARQLTADGRLEQSVDGRLGSDPDPRRGVEVGVGGPGPLPVGPDDRQQIVGMRCVVVEERHLRGGRRRHAGPQAGQIPQVLLAVGVDLGHLLAAGSAARHESDGGHHHHQRHHQHVRRQLPHAGEDHDRDHPEHAAAHHPRQHLLDRPTAGSRCRGRPGGVTLISPGVSRGPRLMIGVNFLVVIRHLPCAQSPARRSDRRPCAGRVGRQGVVFEQRRLLGQHRAVDEQTDHLPRRGLRRRQPERPGGLLVGQSVPHTLRVDVVEALAVAGIRRLQPHVLTAVDEHRCVATDLIDTGVHRPRADRQVAADHDGGLGRLVTRLPFPRPAQRRGILAQLDLQRLGRQR